MAKRAPLDEARVIAVALEVLDEVGFDGVTVRRIAARLGVANPALYWHFRSKAEIIDRMASQLLAGAVVAPRPPREWRRFLLDTARAFRRAMRSRREGARLLASANMADNQMSEAVRRSVDLLAEAGFRRDDALVGIVALVDYTLGATYEEQTDPVSNDRGGGGDRMFEGGLALLLDGLAQRRRRVEAPPRTRRRPPARRAPRKP
ncbi:MAG TPA: TetR/AcrR family transcriptional regulator C-terminal domain-containing protein [Kofleriaceae bacterium]|nr:TetR/AcrR family transcriptional regulator C-terminal domain-containing protein [Kofleriaceae bacterium]